MLRSEPERKRRRYLMFVLCVAVGVLVGVWQNRASMHGRSAPLTSFVRTVTAPFVAGTSAMWNWSARTIGPVTQAGRLAAESKRLRAENAALREEVGRLTEVAQSGSRLRLGLGLPGMGFARRTPADVIGLRPTTGFDTIVINRGRNAGLGPGDVVISQGALVGHIYDLGPTTAAVILITDTSAAVGARVQRAESRAAGVCRGDGAGFLSMVYLDRQADVRIGDRVVTSGLGGAQGIFPKGIPIGTVVRVADDESGATRQVRVRPFVDVGRLDEVFVVR
jgi:rod shape-determining protein MreC